MVEDYLRELEGIDYKLNRLVVCPCIDLSIHMSSTGTILSHRTACGGWLELGFGIRITGGGKSLVNKQEVAKECLGLPWENKALEAKYNDSLLNNSAWHNVIPNCHIDDHLYKAQRSDCVFN